MEAYMIHPGVSCTSCGSAYPSEGVPYLCSICGGLYDFRDAFHFDPVQVDRSQPGIWRYRHTFGLLQDIKPVSLGEGNTPLVWAEVFGHQVAFKCEFLNPSGSFKDRGSSVIAAWLQCHGVTEAVEDSSGNAGASFAAYAARAGIMARIFIPEFASGPKRRQIEVYGAELVPVPGSRTDVAAAVMKEAETGVAYASHAHLPFNLPGYATAAYEIVEQLGQMPGAVVVPAGQGGLLLGLARGFKALRIDNIIINLPRLIGVQARACAPLWSQFASEGKESTPVAENNTLAEGVRVRNPLRGNSVLAAVMASRGSMCIAEEKEILPARDELARLGFYVEPTSAIVWPALVHLLDKLPDPVVVILTGSGLKYG
jgi:threonine synthase